MNRNTALLAAALALGAAPCFANDYGRHHFWSYDDTSYYRAADDGTIHVGAAPNADDQALAERVADALRSDRRLSEPGITATVTAKDGRVSLSGSANDERQAMRAEAIARRVAGAGNVSGTLSSEAG
ncbi:MAG TPA: BON domain-containing protein [Usitatibacter sp.]|jgi:osmotically-inducible protein OsmY|nr:BON domain-containing protein [Usitatibacter sp.]